MKNFLLTIAYVGTRYHGYQVQKNLITVAGTFQDALEDLLGVRADITGCSRTDSGVHANGYCLNFRTDMKISPQSLIMALNVRLPEDISVVDCREVPIDFHARYSCVRKEYLYLFLNSHFPNPFYHNRAMFFPHPMDEKLLDRAAKEFTGTHDFKAFCASGCTLKNTTRTIFESGVTRQGDLLTFRICGDGFLYNMVRIIAGTLIEVSKGRFTPENIKEMILSRDRTKTGMTAPPHGLYLNRVFYE